MPRQYDLRYDDATNKRISKDKLRAVFKMSLCRSQGGAVMAPDKKLAVLIRNTLTKEFWDENEAAKGNVRLAHTMEVD